jgi:hypothetical protein
MPQETVGYVELEWTCKRCGTRNSGLNKVCSQCGAPMEESQGFEAPAEQKIITDEKKLEQAAKGPDIICPYCGTRNAAGSTKCTQCGGDFSGAKSLETGKVIGALDTGPVPDVKCLVCGTMNPAANVKCAKCGAPLPKVQPKAAPAPAPAATAPAGNPRMMLLIIAGVILVCVVGALLLLGGSRTTDAQGVVQSASWERSIQILAPVPVSLRAWEDQIPSSARMGTCEQRVRREQEEPAPNAQKVCGTPYLVDQGSGVAKAVQDCVYRVYENYCEYTQMQFAPVNVVVERGEGSNPRWPAASLTADQQEGQRIERYRVVFENDGKQYEYLTNDPREYAALQTGTQWKLKVNGAGQVVAVEPAN